MIVLDASAAVEMIRKTDDGKALWDLCLRNEKIVTCDLFRAEIASVYRKLTRTGGVTAEMAEAYFYHTLTLIDAFYPIDDLQSEALRESIRLNHSTYDLFYFVLARRTGATLFTVDERLIKLCAKNGVEAVSIVSSQR